MMFCNYIVQFSVIIFADDNNGSECHSISMFALAICMHLQFQFTSVQVQTVKNYHYQIFVFVIAYLMHVVANK